MNPPVKDKAYVERIQTAIRSNPRQLTVVLARQLGVPEADVISAMPENLRCDLDVSRWEELIRSFEELGKVHVICTNNAVTLEAFGQFGNFSTAGPFFNVQTASLDMHIRSQHLGSAYAIEKPGHMDGVNTLSVQFFDTAGNSAFKVFLTFGGDKPSDERIAQFDAIRQRFKKI